MDQLTSDPKRQAIPTLKGYTYQIWQSLFHWISLNETGLVFLEGAEDIDLLRSCEAETVQIKATAENITLQSTAAQEAILHYWQHRHTNPNIELCFKLLTTSERGVERSKPFGDRPGLDVWDSCKYPGTDLTRLRDFLLTQTVFTPNLKTFIRDSSDEQLRDQLIARIDWDTGTQSRPYVEAAVIRQVSAYGDRIFNLQQSESEKVIPHLLNHVWQTIVKERDRWLDLPKFRRVFEEAITERIPKTELAKMRRDALELAQLRRRTDALDQTHRQPSLFRHTVLAPLISIISDRFLPRKELVAEYKTRLNTTGLLILKGSTGMGKSTLASGVAHALPGAWHKLDLRGLGPEQITNRLEYAASLIEDRRQRIDCLVDDINFEREQLMYEDALGRFMYAVKSVNGRTIISTQGSLPIRISNQYELSPSCSMQVPPLTQEEIRQLCINYGCTEDRHLAIWSKFIHLNSQGHPQLAHAGVLGFAAKNWPVPAPRDRLTAPDLDEVRRQIRNRLRDALPSEEARVLLYRLSILMHFHKHQAICLGNHAPVVRLAGEIFDSLTGPWIEQFDETRFRLSPLLYKAASEIFTAGDIKELHAVAARSYLQHETIDVTDLDAMLFHGILGEAVEPLQAALMTLSNVPEESRIDVSQVLDWFTDIAISNEGKIFPEPFVNVLLRHLQFRIAETRHVDRAIQIAEKCVREMDELDYSKLHPDLKRTMQLMFLKDFVCSLEVPFTVDTVVDHLLRLIILLRDTNPMFADHPAYDPAKEASLRALLTADDCLRVAVVRCRDGLSVLHFLNLLCKKSFEETKEVWEIFTRNTRVCMMLVSQIWLDAGRQATPDWNLCLERVEQVTRIAHARKATALMSAAYYAKATVQQEYLKDQT